MPNFNSVILEEPVALTAESREEVDSIILKAIRAQPLGKPLQILLLTADELKNYQPGNEEFAHDRLKKIYSRLKQFSTELSLGISLTTDGNQGIITLRFDDLHKEELFKAKYLDAQEIFLPLNEDQVVMRIKEVLNSYSTGDLKIDAVSDEEARLVNQRLLKLPPYRGQVHDPEQADRFYLRCVAEENQILISKWLINNGIRNTMLEHQSDIRIAGAERRQIVCVERRQIVCNEVDIPKLSEILNGPAIAIPLSSQEKEAFIKFRDSINKFKSSGSCPDPTAEILDNLFEELVAHAKLNKQESLFLVEKLTKLTELSASPSASKDNPLKYFEALDSFIVNKKSSNPHFVGLIVGAGIGFIVGAAIGAALTAFAGGAGAFATAQLGAIMGLALVTGFGVGGAAVGGSLGKAGFFSSSSESESNTKLTNLIESAKKSLSPR